MALQVRGLKIDTGIIKGTLMHLKILSRAKRKQINISRYKKINEIQKQIYFENVLWKEKEILVFQQFYIRHFNSQYGALS